MENTDLTNMDLNRHTLACASSLVVRRQGPTSNPILKLLPLNNQSAESGRLHSVEDVSVRKLMTDPVRAGVN
ncbi:MAG: hypothetical protein FRX49_09263, partial [Trebouxia sp. A1-2]